MQQSVGDERKKATHSTNENDLSPKELVETRGEMMVSETLDERSCLEGTYKCKKILWTSASYRIVTNGCNFVLYAWRNRQPVKRSKKGCDMIRFLGFTDKLYGIKRIIKVWLSLQILNNKRTLFSTERTRGTAPTHCVTTMEVHRPCRYQGTHQGLAKLANVQVFRKTFE